MIAGHQRSAPPSRRRRIALGGALYLLATLQYGIAQVVTAAAWNPPYDWFHNYISDLGNTACGMFAVPHATPSFVCSPLHAVMNASFVLSGVLVVVGTLLLRRFWPLGRWATCAQVLWVVAGFGKLAVGLIPENTNGALHAAAALNIPIAGAAILVLSLTVLRERTALALTGLGLFVVGLMGAVLLIAAQVSGFHLAVDFGVGALERLAGYPANLWLVVVAIIAIAERTAAR